MVSRRNFSDEVGKMVLALMLALLLISVSLIALSTLTWQLKKEQTYEADWETQMALNSGIAWATQTISTVGSDSTCAKFNKLHTRHLQVDGQQIRRTLRVRHRMRQSQRKPGLYRWYIVSCTSSADNKLRQ